VARNYAYANIIALSRWNSLTPKRLRSQKSGNQRPKISRKHLGRKTSKKSGKQKSHAEGGL
jgi:hypothetical protein